MKGRAGKLLRQEGAINRIELTIEKYEKILPAEKELLKLMRKEKDLAPDNIPTMDKKILHPYHIEWQWLQGQL